MTINVKALRDTMNIVETAAKLKGVPDGWEQSTWRCKTGKCFAGHGVSLADGLSWFNPNPDSSDPYVRHTELGVSYCDSAMEYFYGLTKSEAFSLFHLTNTLDDLRQMIAAIEVIAEMDPEAIE